MPESEKLLRAQKETDDMQLEMLQATIEELKASLDAANAEQKQNNGDDVDELREDVQE